MAQTITELLGANATLSNGTVTIQLADLTDSNNNPYLASPSSATASQTVAAILAYLVRVTDGKSSDETAGIAAADFQNEKSFVTRGESSQIQQPFTINCYRPDNLSTFDPDDVI